MGPAPESTLWMEILKMAAVGVCDLEGESQLPPASPGGSPGSVSGSDTGTFQTAASGLGHRVCEILCAAFIRVESSFPAAPQVSCT